MINERFAKRFTELQIEFEAIPYKGTGTGITYADGRTWQKWATSSASLIKAACREDSPYYKNFVKAYEKCHGHSAEVKLLGGVFLSAKEAFDGGYIFDVERDVSAEIFGDFVVLAKQALSESHKDVAAVLASAALEDALQRHATSNGLNVDNSTMSDVIGALKSKGLVSGAQKSMLTAMLRTRNFAMHAKWDKITEPDVSGLVGFVEQFLLTNFGGR